MKFYGKKYSILCGTLFQKLDNKLKQKLIVVCHPIIRKSNCKGVKTLGFCIRFVLGTTFDISDIKYM